MLAFRPAWRRSRSREPAALAGRTRTAPPWGGVGETLHTRRPRPPLLMEGSFIGTYLQIVPPEKLVYTWIGGAVQSLKAVVTLDFLDHGALTELVLTHEGLNTEAVRALVEGGWPSLLDALASVLSSPHLDL